MKKEITRKTTKAAQIRHHFRNNKRKTMAKICTRSIKKNQLFVNLPSTKHSGNIFEILFTYNRWYILILHYFQCMVSCITLCIPIANFRGRVEIARQSRQV